MWNEQMVPILEVLAKIQLPWWCYARADTLANFSTHTWDMIRRSKLKMAFIGADVAEKLFLGVEILKKLAAPAEARQLFQESGKLRIDEDFSVFLLTLADKLEDDFSFGANFDVSFPERRNAVGPVAFYALIGAHAYIKGIYY
jgi:hypothetical protein